MNQVYISDKSGSVSVLENPSQDAKYVFLLAHGAGAGMQHKFMESIASGLSKLNGTVVRFNFPYLEKGRKAPGSPKEAINTIIKMVEYVKEKYSHLPLLIGGKSYGGRMSSHAVLETHKPIAGLVYLGFPLHAPGRDGISRADHTYDISQPQLFLQGTNDKLANFEMISGVIEKQKKASMVVIEKGDHSFKAPKSAGKSADEIMEFMVKSIDDWAVGLVQ